MSRGVSDWVDLQYDEADKQLQSLLNVHKVEPGWKNHKTGCRHYVDVFRTTYQWFSVGRKPPKVIACMDFIARCGVNVSTPLQGVSSIKGQCLVCERSLARTSKMAA